MLILSLQVWSMPVFFGYLHEAEEHVWYWPLIEILRNVLIRLIVSRRSISNPIRKVLEIYKHPWLPTIMKNLWMRTFDMWLQLLLPESTQLAKRNGYTGINYATAILKTNVYLHDFVRVSMVPTFGRGASWISSVLLCVIYLYIYSERSCTAATHAQLAWGCSWF